MALVNLSEAARQAGISRTHLYKRYIQPGKISVDRSDPKAPTIDTAELLRVFGHLGEHTTENSENTPRTHDLTPPEHSEDVPLQPEVAALRERLQDAQEQIRAGQQREAWLQTQVDKLTDSIKLIEHKTDPQPRRGWWARLTGR